MTGPLFISYHVKEADAYISRPTSLCKQSISLCNIFFDFVYDLFTAISFRLTRSHIYSHKTHTRVCLCVCFNIYGRKGKKKKREEEKKKKRERNAL